MDSAFNAIWWEGPLTKVCHLSKACRTIAAGLCLTWLTCGYCPAPARGQTTSIQHRPVAPHNVRLASTRYTAVPATSGAPNSQLLQALKYAAENLDAGRITSMDAARTQLQLAIADLDAFLGSDPNNANAWYRFLRIDQLEEEAAKAQPNPAVLNELLMNMRQNYVGLELPVFDAVRDATNTVLRASKYSVDPERTIGIITRRIEQLSEQLATPREGARTETDALAMRIMTYLHESSQDPQLVAQIRQNFARPNLEIQVAENFINQLLARGVAEPTAVNECLLGTRIIGDACLAGNLSVDVLPMIGGVSLNLNLSATMTSQNKGYNRGVVLRSSASSPVFASKPVVATASGVSTGPASVSVNLHSTIHSISHKFRIVERIARRKAAEQKPLANAISEERLRKRVRQGYDQQVESQLAEARTRLGSLKQQRPEMKRLEIPRPALTLFSTDQSVNANVVAAAVYQPAAAIQCPLPEPMNTSLLVKVHQSALLNPLDLLFTGRKFASADLDDFARQFVDEVPPELLTEAQNESWKIAMSSFRPVEVEFDDGRAKLTLRMSQLAGPNGDIKGNSSVTAVYVPTLESGNVILRRDGDVNTNFGRGGLKTTTTKAVLLKKFDTVFKETIEIPSAELLGKISGAPSLRIASLDLDDGWLQVSVR